MDPRENDERWITQRLNQGADSIVPASAWTDIAGTVAARSRARRHRRGLSAVAASAVVVIAIATVVSVYRRDDRGRVGTISQPTTPTKSWTTSLIPQSPLAARIRPALVWIDDALLVWGGDDDYISGAAQEQNRQTFFDDGAIYQPASRRWIPMPAAPFGPSESPPKAIAAGGSAVVWRGAELAVFDMATATWTSHKSFASTIGAVAWTGTELLVVGPDVAVDLDAGAPRSIASAPAAFARVDAIWTDAGLVVVGRTTEETCVAFILDRSGAWRSIAPPEFRNQYVAATRLGSKVFVALWAEPTGIETFELTPTTDAWTRVVAPDAPPAIWLPVVAATRSDVLLLKPGRAYVRAPGEDWVVVGGPELPGIGSVVAGDDGAFWAAGMEEGATALRVVDIHRG